MCVSNIWILQFISGIYVFAFILKDLRKRGLRLCYHASVFVRLRGCEFRKLTVDLREL
jgi:hypothetical protein